MGANTPHLKLLTVNIAPGAKVTFKDNDIGIQRAIYLPKTVLERNPFLTFGPAGTPFQLNLTVGVFVQWDEDFDELVIDVPAAAAGNAVGTILMSGCPNFLMLGV